MKIFELLEGAFLRYLILSTFAGAISSPLPLFTLKTINETTLVIHGSLEVNLMKNQQINFWGAF